MFFDLGSECWVEIDLIEKGKRFSRLSEGCELPLIFFFTPPHATLWLPARPCGAVTAGGTSVGNSVSV